jgi:predicted nucleic acid-binding protein
VVNTPSDMPNDLSQRIVLDNSMVLAMIMPDEFDEQAEALKTILRSVQVHVPYLWIYEFSNALNTNIRRKRLTPADAVEIAQIVESWDLQVDAQTLKPIALSQLARDNGLTTYDASYLELSRRLNAPLYTLDAQLQKAAQL